MGTNSVFGNPQKSIRHPPGISGSHEHPSKYFRREYIYIMEKQEHHAINDQLHTKSTQEIIDYIRNDQKRLRESIDNMELRINKLHKKDLCREIRSHFIQKKYKNNHNA